MNKTNRLLVWILVLAFLGLADSWYLAETALNNTVPTCDVAAFHDCAEVAQSPYAKPLGIPLGVYGAMFSAALFMLAALALVFRDRALYTTIFILTMLAGLGSVALLFIQAAVLNAFCVYCLLFELISFALFFVALKLYKHTRPRVLVA